MRTEDYELMHALEGEFWWFVGMREVTGSVLGHCLRNTPRDVLDVGCGTGINLLYMSGRLGPRRVVGCDYSDTALACCRATTSRPAETHARRLAPPLARADARALPFASNSFDLVTSFDVLDVFAPGGDVKVMEEMHRVLRPGAIALIRGPAYQWLLSSHDTLFETQHRFTCGELQRKMESVGFQTLHRTYANALLFPVALAQRLMRKWFGLAPSKTDAQPWPKSMQWLNAPMTGFLRLEARWLARGLTFPFGLSAICVGRKPALSPAGANPVR